MTLSELHTKLKDKGISEDRYFLHGLYGSTDDNEKIALTIIKGQHGIEYQVYSRERGEKYLKGIFDTENEACEYIYKTLTDEQTFWCIQKTEGLSGMTVNERLWVSGLMDEFEQAKKKDIPRAKTILRWLKVDGPSIEKIVKDQFG